MTTILIADDSRLMQRNLTISLQQAGYDVLYASDGFETLEACLKKTPDLAIIDCIMPGMTGQDVCRTIRTTPATQHLPVILMSSEDRELKQARAVGAQGTLLKPIETKELLLKVTNLLAPVPENHSTLSFTNLFDPAGNPAIARIIRVHSDRLVTLANIPGVTVTPGQKVQIQYDAVGGIRITRDAEVRAAGYEGIALELGALLTHEQRRRNFRKQITLPVRYRLPGDFYRLGQSIDISAGGMRLSGMSGQLETGMKLDFQLVLDPSVLLTVQGIIRRVAPSENSRKEVGIEFADIDPNVQQELTMFLFAGTDFEL